MIKYIIQGEMEKKKNVINTVCYVFAIIFGLVGVFLAYLNNEIITGFLNGFIMETVCFVVMQIVLAMVLFFSKSKIRSETFENAGWIGFAVYVVATPIMFLIIYKDLMGAVFSVISCFITLIIPFYIYKKIIPVRDMGGSDFSYHTIEDKQEDNKKSKANDFEFNTENKYDNFGHYIGKVTTFRVGGVETKTFENSKGNKTREDTTLYWNDKK